MPGMKITLDAAMRARDVSRPRPEHEAAADRRAEPHGMRYSFDVTGLVDRLQAQGAWDPGRVTVSMLPAVDDDEPEPLGAAVAARVRVGTFSLYLG